MGIVLMIYVCICLEYFYLKNVNDATYVTLISFFFRKPKRITGFALKQLEKNFPKGTKHLKDFYNWSKDRDSEFNLLQKISKSL